MAGTATNFDITKISAGRVVQLWYGLAIPAVGAIATLHTDGTPDATANPSAKHLGFTDKGAVVTARGEWTDYMGDEQSGPLKTVFAAGEMRITADLLQVEDMNIMQLLSSGFGTLAAITGGQRLGFGVGTQAYTSLAAIWALEADSTKYCIFHIFRSANKSGISFNKSRTEKSIVSADFQGYDIAGRTATEAMGYYYVPTAS